MSEEDIESQGKIANLELVHWVSEEQSFRGQALEDGTPAQAYLTFDELYQAILDHGPLILATDRADVIFIAVSGKFDGHIMAIRQSGRNVRRFLIRQEHFGQMYGSVQNCINHMLSNNAVDSELEISHLEAFAEEHGISKDTIDPSKRVDRLQVDIIAALQLLDTFRVCYGEDGNCQGSFDLGYSVGRLFSSIQNLATLEEDAKSAEEYRRSYRERGLKGKSGDRKEKRLDHLFGHLCKLVEQNPALSRLKPREVANLALSDCIAEEPKLWSQGKGQIDQYLTAFSSNDKYRQRYRQLFPKTG